MATIHNVQLKASYEYRIDPKRGAVRERQESIIRSDTDRIVHNGETYEIDEDGNFNVPDDLAQFLTSQPDWHEGENPFPPAEEPKSKTKRTSARA